MNDSQLMFDERLRQLGKMHQALSCGYTTRMRPDGLVIRIPKRAKPGVSGRQVVVVVLVFLMVKVFLISSLGEREYSVRLVQLQQGSAVDRAGAVLMQLDPFSLSLARALGTVPRYPDRRSDQGG